MTDEPNDELILSTEDPPKSGGKFYFIRAFWTTMGILLSWTLWVLLPAIVLVVIISIYGSIGSLVNDEPTDGPQESQPTSCASTDPAWPYC
jgi:hypothetical protein